MKAEFSSLSRDLFWTYFHWPECKGESEKIRWTGYDDGYWWHNVSKSEQFQVKTAKDGTKFRLNPQTNELSIED